MLTVCGYSLAHLGNHDKSFTSIVKNGRYSLEHLCNVITEYAKKIILTRKHYKCQKLTNEQKQKHEQTDQCHFCKKPFITDKNHEKYHKLKKVIDHDHYRRNYRGVAHSICNLRATRSNDTFLGIHNGSGYDFKLLLKKFAFHFEEVISFIAETIEKNM